VIARSGRLLVRSPVGLTVVWHGVAIAALLGYTWFVFQPIRGSDIALWSPLFGVFFVVGAWLIAGGVFVWARWGSGRGLLLGDLLGLVPPGFVAVLYGILGVTLFLPVVIPVVVGLFLARGAVRRGHVAPNRPQAAHPLLVGLLAILVALSWWYALIYTFDPFVGFYEYAFAEAVSGGVALFAILLWLDRRPGLLLGAGIASAYFGGSSVAVGVAHGFAEGIVVGSLLLLTGLVGAWVAGRDVLEQPSVIGRAVSLGVAAITGIALVAAPMLSPLGVVAAVALERRAPADSPDDAPENPDAPISAEPAAA
jgi:hypothetical protein